MRLPEVIYIGGYGRSGSTILDITLSQADSVFSGGELRTFTKFIDKPDAMCACGHTLSQCPVWGNLFKNISHYLNTIGLNASSFRRLQNRIESGLSFNLAGNWFTANERELSIYRKVYTIILSSIVALGYNYVVDSSKTDLFTTVRPLALNKIVGAPVTFIHLVRHPKGVLNSVKKGMNRDLEKGISRNRPFSTFRATIGWIRANLSASIAASTVKGKGRTFIRFEDFLSNPEREINRICNLVGLDSTLIHKWIKNGRHSSKIHTLGGNRVRFEKVRLDPTRGL